MAARCQSRRCPCRRHRVTTNRRLLVNGRLLRSTRLTGASAAALPARHRYGTSVGCATSRPLRRGSWRGGCSASSTFDSRVARGAYITKDAAILVALTMHVATVLETARVAEMEVSVRTEEPDERPGLGERRNQVAEGAERGQQVGGAEWVESQNVHLSTRVGTCPRLGPPTQRPGQPQANARRGVSATRVVVSSGVQTTVGRPRTAGWSEQSSPTAGPDQRRSCGRGRSKQPCRGLRARLRVVPSELKVVDRGCGVGLVAGFES